jgi:hypothetical protein
LNSLKRLRKKQDKTDKFCLLKPSDAPKYTSWIILKRFLFFWWDGLAFFSITADHKLPRLLGNKPGLFDKYKNVRNSIKHSITFVLVTIVIFS